jgi:hypothetical protein
MENKPQLDKFKEAAKDLGCDESEERFDANVKKLAKAGGDKKPDKKD